MGHETTPLRVKRDPEDVSTVLDNGEPPEFFCSERVRHQSARFITSSRFMTTLKCVKREQLEMSRNNSKIWRKRIESQEKFIEVRYIENVLRYKVVILRRKS
ncbi:hypothetical protein TNCV_4612041 [Trichonephila clavipes]|nr:hypothetical protein TNCV_4612041 [Trichonephila clavipes]